MHVSNPVLLLSYTRHAKSLPQRLPKSFKLFAWAVATNEMPLKPMRQAASTSWAEESGPRNWTLRISAVEFQHLF